VLFASNPSRRKRTERFLADLLTRHWSLLAEGEKRLAVESAVEFGLTFAEEWPGDEPDLQAYVDVVVWWAHDAVKAINETELAMWETGDPDDPRVLAFAIGCEGWREHGSE